VFLIGMCSRCFSSGVSVVFDKNNFEVICDKCKNNLHHKNN